MLDFPSPATTGQVYLNWQFDGTKWVVAGAGSSGATITVSDTAPASPTVGALWYDTLGTNLYVWTTDGNSTQWALAVSPPFPPAQAAAGNTGRNLVHNGQFNIWQRGTGAFTAVGYTADRWYLGFSGDTNSVSRQTATDAMRAVAGDEAWQYYISNSFTGTSAATAYSELIHPVENVRRLSGKTVTLSFWAWVSVGTAQLGLSGYNYYGSGGSPSASDAFPLITPAALTSSVQRFSRTFTIPSASGRTLGTNSNDATNFQFWFSSGANNAPTAGIGVQSGTFNIWGVQLEIGSGYGFPTPLAKRDPADELQLCQRFYQTGFVNTGSYGQAGWPLIQTVPFLVAMRATPSIAFTGPTYTNCSGLTAGTITSSNISPTATVTATGGASFYSYFTASADL